MGLAISLLIGASFAACCAETLLADNSAATINSTGPNLLNMAARKNTSVIPLTKPSDPWDRCQPVRVKWPHR